MLWRVNPAQHPCWARAARPLPYAAVDDHAVCWRSGQCRTAATCATGRSARRIPRKSFRSQLFIYADVLCDMTSREYALTATALDARGVKCLVRRADE